MSPNFDSSLFPDILTQSAIRIEAIKRTTQRHCKHVFIFNKKVQNVYPLNKLMKQWILLVHDFMYRKVHR